MAWASYSTEELAARQYEVSRSKGKEYWTVFMPQGVAPWVRAVDIIEYQADGFSETGASDAVNALFTAGILNAESSRSGESGKHMVRWTAETYGAWGEV